MENMIRIFDTTLRDGEQTPGVSLNIQEKLEIAKLLAKLNVDIIEAGFPIASPGDFEAVKAIAKNVKGPVIAGLARANKADIDRAWEALREAEKPRIHTFIATSPVHMKYKLQMEPDAVLRAAVEAVKYAKGFTEDVEFSAEDASRTDLSFLCDVMEAVIEAGATTINIPDTVGYTTPAEFGRIIATIKSKVKGIDGVIISVHCHNDLGLAVANSIAAVENGARQIECTINGLGERAGNAALEELVMAIKTRKDVYPYHTGIQTEYLYRTSRLVSALSGVTIQPNKAIVGSNAFAHESGIHQHGVLQERTTYEIIDPTEIGLAKNKLVLGKHSGRHAFREKLIEMGYQLSDDELSKAFKRFKDLADKKKEIMDGDIEAIVNEETFTIPESCKLDYLHISSGNKVVPTATLRLEYNGQIYEEAATGGGPIDASYRTIDRITGYTCTLVDYVIRAATRGKDAIGEVTVKVSYQDKVFIGRGFSTDILEASVKAYLNAINKIIYENEHKRQRGDGNGNDNHRENFGSPCR